MYNIPQGFPTGSRVKNSAANGGDPGLISDWEDPLEKEMATHSSILTWKILWTEEPDGLESTGHKKVRHDLATEQQQHYKPQTVFYIMTVTTKITIQNGKMIILNQ